MMDWHYCSSWRQQARRTFRLDFFVFSCSRHHHSPLSELH